MTVTTSSPVTYQVFTFVLMWRETWDLVGTAVLCPDARYSSVLWVGQDRIERPFASPEAWKAIAQQIAAGLPNTPLPTSSPIAELVVSDAAAGVIVAFLGANTLTLTDPATVVTTLDAWLRTALAARDGG